MKKIFLNLGKQPLANSFLPSISKKTLTKEFFYDLKIAKATGVLAIIGSFILAILIFCIGKNFI